MEVSGQLHAASTLSLGKELLVPIEEVAGQGSESVRMFLRRKICFLYRESNHDSSAVEPVAWSLDTELFRLVYGNVDN